MSLSVGVCPSLPLSVPVCPCLSLSVLVCPCLSLSVPVYPCRSLSVSVCPCMPSLYLYVIVRSCLFMSVPVTAFPPFMSLSLSCLIVSCVNICVSHVRMIFCDADFLLHPPGIISSFYMVNTVYSNQQASSFSLTIWYHCFLNFRLISFHLALDLYLQEGTKKKRRHDCTEKKKMFFSSSPHPSRSNWGWSHRWWFWPHMEKLQNLFQRRGLPHTNFWFLFMLLLVLSLLPQPLETNTWPLCCQMVCWLGVGKDMKALSQNYFCQNVRLSVRLSVCLSICVLTFEVPFKRFFAPISQSRMSNIFRDSESLGKSNGKNWSQIWTFLFESCLKSPHKKSFFLLILLYKTLWKPRFPLD